MGLIKTIKKSFARAKAVGMQAKAELEEAARYRSMTRAEAELLPDEALWDCVSFRLCRLEAAQVLAEESLARRAVYTVDTFDREDPERRAVSVLCQLQPGDGAGAGGSAVPGGGGVLPEAVP